MSPKKRQGRRQALGDRVRGGSQRLGTLGRSIRPRVIERLHLTRRHALAPWVRTSLSFCKDRTPRRRRVGLLQAFDNFARPHMRLRGPLPAQEPHGLGVIQPTGCHRTPAMAAGLTDPVWTFRERLTVQLAPIHNQSGSG